jgi:hypothetical protein
LVHFKKDLFLIDPFFLDIIHYMNEIILGFDISTKCIGYGVLKINNNSIEYVDSNFLQLKKEDDLIKRLAITRDEISNLIKNINPNYIGIENIIQFMKGKSSAKIIISLATFNRMIALLAYDFLGRSPELFNVISIRHGLKIKKILPKKQDIPELVSTHLGITFPYEKNKKGIVKVENYDKADGIAVALYYAFLLTGKRKGLKK